LTSVGTLSSLSVTGTVTGGNLLVTGAGAISTAGTVTGSLVGGTLTTTAQPNIASVGTLGSLSVTGNITGGNVLGGANVNATTHTGTTVNVTGNITGGNVLFGSGVVSGTGAITGGNITGGNLLAGSGAISTSGTVTGTLLAGTLSTTAQPNIASVGTLTSLSVTANITGGNLSVSTGTVTVGNIVCGAGNLIGNIGTATTWFGNAYVKAVNALYADLAENYTTDAEYAPGTIVSFGGTAEITISSKDADHRVAGVVSTNPSYIMNAGLNGAGTVSVALTGRVPTSVTGTVRKGDLMVSAGNGVARAESAPSVGTVIGKALADSEGDAVIEVVVGRF
jgi:hypothetical protein